MNREVVYLPKDENVTSDILHGERNEDWLYIDEETAYTDLSKGIEDIIVILQRKSDGKFFQFEYARNDDHNKLDDRGLANDWPLKGEEVFKKQKTIDFYE